MAQDHDHDEPAPAPASAGDLAGWLCCDRCGAVLPAGDSAPGAGLNLAAGHPCPLCGPAGPPFPDPNAPGLLRPARASDLGCGRGG
jgi:hypothetical protein